MCRYLGVSFPFPWFNSKRGSRCGLNEDQVTCPLSLTQVQIRKPAFDLLLQEVGVERGERTKFSDRFVMAAKSKELDSTESICRTSQENECPTSRRIVTRDAPHLCVGVQRCVTEGTVRLRVHSAFTFLPVGSLVVVSVYDTGLVCPRSTAVSLMKVLSGEGTNLKTTGQ